MVSTNSWCIVALPEEGHPVHKVSSEKSAHMTILFLGDQREPALAIRIIEAIQHTIATSFKHKFSLGVQKRGTLGQDQADVLFFYKDETGRVKDFRSLLLKDDDIKKAYDSTEQFPEWTPHLTLGYPDSPANPMPDDNHSISWITFDRIALWLEDSDGPEIELGNYGSDLATPEEAYHRDQMIQKGMVAMESTDDFLAHYGVKGMRWGQRKASTSSASGKKKTLGQQLNQSKFGEISRKNVKRHNAQVAKKKAKAATKETRKEYKARIKKEQNEFYNKKMTAIVDKAAKAGDDVLIKTMYGGDVYQTITTGSEFVKQLSKGMAFDVTLTEVYATKTAEGPYQMTGDRNVYQKSKRRK